MRTLINLLIATGLLLIFNAFGWLTLSSGNKPIELDHLTWPMFGSVVLVAVILWLAGVLAGLLYGIASCLTLGLMLFAYPLVGWVALKLTAHFAPDSLALHGFWITVLCGFLLMIVKIHSPKSDTENAS